jgi:FkbM family methyltransferase
MKLVIQRVLNRLGYEVRRLRPPSKAPLLNVLSLVVEDYLKRKEARGDGDFYFVQIGANNGISVDPMRPYILKHHWRGILVEPHPTAFAQLVENYRAEPQLAFENAAIAEHDGVTSLYSPKHRAGIGDLTLASSFDRAAVARISRHYGTEVEELSLPALTIQSLLAKHGVRSIDLVQIDAEGFDDRIVAMFARSGVLPAIFHFEIGSLPPERYRTCLDLLAELGYRIVTVGLDAVAYRQGKSLGAAPFGTCYGYHSEFPATDAPTHHSPAGQNSKA